MASGIFKDYFGKGVIADRPAAPVIPTDTLAAWYATDTNSLSIWDGAAWQDLISNAVPYRVSFFFTTTPDASEILFIHTAVADFNMADDFAGSVGDIGTNPTASFVLVVKLNGASIGTITISTGGAFTFATTGGAVAVVTGDILSVTGPASADATAANCSVTFDGAE